MENPFKKSVNNAKDENSQQDNDINIAEKCDIKDNIVINNAFSTIFLMKYLKSYWIISCKRYALANVDRNMNNTNTTCVVSGGAPNLKET